MAQLNLFGTGFPISIGTGFIMIGIALPYLATLLNLLFQKAIGMIRQICAEPEPAARPKLICCKSDNLLLHLPATDFAR